MKVEMHFIGATRRNMIAAAQWLDQEFANTAEHMLNYPNDRVWLIQVYGEDFTPDPSDPRKIAFTMHDTHQPHNVNFFQIIEEFPGQECPTLHELNGEWPDIELDLSNRHIHGVSRNHEEEG